MIKMEKRNRKIARLWCLAKDCGMDSDMLHVAVEGITGKNSIKSLSMHELNASIQSLIDCRNKMRAKQYRRNQQGRKHHISYMPTPAQRLLVSKIMSNLTHKLALTNPEGFLDAICNKTFGKKYAHLTRTQMKNLIEALKSIQNRE